MALTNSAELAARMRRLRSHGITREASELEAASPGPWYYEQVELGFNYRMTDIQAALGVSQMSRLDQYVERRCQLAARYDALLAEAAVDRPVAGREAGSAWHLYVVRVAEAARRNIFDFMRGQGIGVNVHYIPVHLQPWYRRIGFAPGDFPEAERHYARALTLPLYPMLQETAQDMVVSVLYDAIEAFDA